MVFETYNSDIVVCNCKLQMNVRVYIVKTTIYTI